MMYRFRIPQSDGDGHEWTWRAFGTDDLEAVRKELLEVIGEGEDEVSKAERYIMNESLYKAEPTYVNVYEITRHYGGPEEGGWWYSVFEPVASIPCWTEEEVRSVTVKMRERYPLHKKRFDDNVYLVRESAFFAKTYPTTKQVYS